MVIFNKDAQHKCFENEREGFTYFGASVVSSSSEYWEAQCCRDHIDMLKHESLSKSLILIKSLISITFWENQSGGRPGSEKGLMALLTDTLTKHITAYQTYITVNI